MCSLNIEEKYDFLMSKLCLILILDCFKRLYKEIHVIFNLQITIDFSFIKLDRYITLFYLFYIFIWIFVVITRNGRLIYLNKMTKKETLYQCIKIKLHINSDVIIKMQYIM